MIFAGTLALGVFMFSTIRRFVTDLFSFLFGNILAIAGDLLALLLLGGGVSDPGRALEGAPVRDFDPLARPPRACGGSLEYLFLASWR